MLFGFGAINRRLADLLAAFGCVVTPLGRGWTAETLAEALSSAEIVVSTVPSTPFWTCPNLLLTQHSGGGTTDEIDRKSDHFLANLALYRAGRPLTGRVDFVRGY